MRAFVDTSTLFKKYVQEPGSDEFQKILEDITDIAVSPVTWIEIHAVLANRIRECGMSPREADQVRDEVKKDFGYFRHVRWTDALVQQSCKVTSQTSLRTLDSIQLGAAILSLPDCVITSDRRFYTEAKKFLKSVFLV